MEKWVQPQLVRFMTGIIHMSFQVMGVVYLVFFLLVGGIWFITIFMAALPISNVVEGLRDIVEGEGDHTHKLMRKIEAIGLPEAVKAMTEKAETVLGAPGTTFQTRRDG